MRVIAGKFKGRRLYAPQGDKIRPTYDRVKETMFNSMQFEIPGAVVLDLFAGTGALGIEAASRGAASVVLVDQDEYAAALIRKNIERMNNPEEIEVVQNSFQNAVKMFQHSKKFDIVFIDPPYNNQLYVEALDTLIKMEVLQENALLVLEMNIDCDIEVDADLFKLWKAKDIGSTKICYYTYKGE